MHTKEGIFNLALGALLLQRRITDTATDPSNEAKVLNTNYDIAFAAALESMDLDGTSTQAVLELLEVDPLDGRWGYVYKYPVDCAFLRRIQSCAVMDGEYTAIDKLVRIYDGQKCIFTNQESAIVEYISTDVPVESLSASAGLAVAYQLAVLSAPLITGKGSAKLIDQIAAKYVAAKAAAQEQDSRENFNFTDPAVQSGFVAARTS